MYSYQRISLVAVLLLFTFPQQGITTNKCYFCESKATGYCGDPFNVTGLKLKECDDPDDLCLKQEEIISDQGQLITKLTRACAPQSYCRLSILEECNLCSTDACNSSHILISSLIVTLTSLFLLIFIFR